MHDQKLLKNMFAYVKKKLKIYALLNFTTMKKHAYSAWFVLKGKMSKKLENWILLGFPC